MASFDERDSVCISDAIMDARLAAAPMWQDGDKIGARMAFRDAYDRAMLTPKTRGERPVWMLSVGHDPERRVEAAKAAVASGLLSSEAAKAYLPAPMVTPEGAAIAGLLTGNVVALPNTDDKIRRKIAELRALIEPVKDSGELMAEERQRFNERKQREMKKLDIIVRR
jgi:hypothetical protein